MYCDTHHRGIRPPHTYAIEHSKYFPKILVYNHSSPALVPVKHQLPGTLIFDDVLVRLERSSIRHCDRCNSRFTHRPSRTRQTVERAMKTCAITLSCVITHVVVGGLPLTISIISKQII